MSKKKKQATEELVQTQVLNIEEVRRVANYEKKLSKKPAAICAILGVFMILLGGGSQGYISYNKMMMETSTKQKNVVARKVDDNLQNANSTLTCTLAKAANPDGTNFLATFTYKFTNNNLKGIKKELLMDGYNTQGLITIYEQFTIYQNLATLGNTVNGYSITSVPHENIGFYVTTEADLNRVDASKVPAMYNSVMYTSIDYKLDTKSEEIKNAYEALGFTCEAASDSVNK